MGHDSQPVIPNSVEEAELVLGALFKGWCHALDASDGSEESYENSIRAVFSVHPGLSNYPSA